MEKRENPKLRNLGKVVICLFPTTPPLLPIKTIIITTTISTTVKISVPKHLYNSQEELIKKMAPDSSDCSMVREWQVIGKLKCERFKLDLRENIFTVCQSSHETGCPQSLWSLCSCRFSKSNRIKSDLNSQLTLVSAEGWTRDLVWSPSNEIILQVRGNVILSQNNVLKATFRKKPSTNNKETLWFFSNEETTVEPCNLHRYRKCDTWGKIERIHFFILAMRGLREDMISVLKYVESITEIRNVLPVHWYGKK